MHRTHACLLGGCCSMWKRGGGISEMSPSNERERVEDQRMRAVSPVLVQPRIICLSPPTAAPLCYDKPLCASLDGFALHAATRAGALHLAGREALLRYVLPPPLAQQRLERGASDLVRKPRWSSSAHCRPLQNAPRVASPRGRRAIRQYS
jgi:hypothetical protein